ncbi:type VI secretion system baseplate subunit TssK [Pseudomonas gingeri]|uniref:type VI secretion system baseplate subunit TssK n=1 Tax=Pseudomonas gingeri TaxID=117681 RepID=UPI00159F8F53|nr:type VI secretion system baseplate subunit TssK [Pseudomonas gingeri]NWD04693.1 type VI secretion system baseplate subunit TssK [Pseudomonas gingeri]NWE30941.1 type VI secretion system baseplate subunit TssK [Pseudomonas gingeri]NWE59003.1 type VI secretion system baseplate subunit TssK [Pseudomonas gingeri]NWF02409.1 type VI secretion system baseplate subunit TssK [Pseudomonas gingeri]
MSWNNKVVWSEGMLLQPQHLQQHDRFLQTQLEARVRALRPYSWGFSRLEIDQQQLALGKLSLLSYSAVLPDGTPAGLPFEDEAPLPLDIPADARDLTVVLALPAARPGVPEVDDRPGFENFARHRSSEYEAWDSNGLDNSALMSIGKLRLRLAFEHDVADAYSCIGVARIVERRADNRVVLDRDYCPPCLDVRVAPLLGSFLDELLGLLQQRSDALASRLTQPDGSGAAEIADFLLLQVLNRSLPLVRHLASMTGLHPQTLYRDLAALAGELATFTQEDKRAVAYPVYRHDALAETFSPLMVDLRRSLSAVLDARAIAIALEERQYGIRVAVLPDQELLRSATFVLAVRAQMSAEAVRSGFPPQVKIGSVEKIRDLVNLQLPGIGLRPLPVAPRQLPFHAGFTYFELDRASDYWQQLSNSAGFAMHVAGVFPGLDMQFWAIRL